MRPTQKKTADSRGYDFPDLFRQDTVRIEQRYKEIDRLQQRPEELLQK